MENTRIFFSHISKTKFFVKLFYKTSQFVFALLFSLLLISNVTLADTCDTQLLQIAELGENGYRNRGRICEGLYESPVSADFELVSFVEHPLSQYGKGDTINIELPNVSQQFGMSTVSIRGLALKPRLYYRMDTIFGDDAMIKWPVATVLTSISLKAKELGIYGWQEIKKVMFYIPVNVWVDGKNKVLNSNFDAQVMVRAGVPIQKIAWRLLGEGISVKYTNVKKSYSVGAPIPINITWPKPRPAFVKLEVAAKPMTSNEWIIQIFNIALPAAPESEL